MLATRTSVYPSGGDLATKSVPMMLLAPGLFSTTTGTDHFCPSFSAIRRAVMSEAPPGGLGTTSRRALDGYGACAQATETVASASSTIHAFPQKRLITS